MEYALKPAFARDIVVREPPTRSRAFGPEDATTNSSKTFLPSLGLSNSVYSVLESATCLPVEGIHFLDEQYYCAPVDDYARVVQLIGGDRLAWSNPGVNTKRGFGPDCDDFAWVLRSAFVMDAYRNGARRLPYCFGLIVATKWRLADDITTVRSSHALNWFIADDRRLWFMDTTDSGYIYWPAPNTPSIGPLLEFSWAVV